MTAGWVKIRGAARSWSAVLSLACIAMIGAAVASPALGAPGPRYDVQSSWGDTNLPPGGEGQFDVQVRNIGDGTGSEDLTIVDHLPAGVTATYVNWSYGGLELSQYCSGVGTETVTCVLPASEFANVGGPMLTEPEGFNVTGYLPLIVIDVAIEPGASGSGTNVASVSGGSGPAPAEDVDQVSFDSTPSPFGVTPGSFMADVFDDVHPFGAPDRKAGDHPVEQRVNFDINKQSGLELLDNTRYTAANASLRTVEVTLPRGLVGNPEALPKCDPADFAQRGATKESFAGFPNSTGCPADTQIGYLNVRIDGGFNHGKGMYNIPNELLAHVALYSLRPPKGVPADFAFNARGFVQGHIYPSLDPSQNYAIKTVTPNISTLAVLPFGTEVTIWGVPGDPAHDKFRYYPKYTDGKALGSPWGSTPIRPLLTNPMDCGFDNGGSRIRIESYEHPALLTPVEEYGHPLNVSGCDDPRIRFEPNISMQPTDRAAGAPTGLDVHLQVPQRNDEVEAAKELYAKEGFVKGVSTPPMKKAVVTFPEGMTLSPSAAQGLVSCSPAQIGLGTNDPVTCPDNSQYGKLTLHTPILPVDAQPEGFIYIAKQGDNPFHNFLSIYLVVEERDRGILVKVPGRIDLDPKTGQIQTTFDELPQFPVSDMQMSFKGGVRAGLVNPTTCGTKTISAEFFSWADPRNPQVVKDHYDVTRKPDGSRCVDNLAERGFRPGLEAGTLSNSGGTYSPFLFRLTRSDDDQEFSQVGVTLPPGLAAKFAGVGSCSDAAIVQAEGRIGAGQGALEQRDPSCPASSQIGTTQVGAGVGVPLVYVPGKAYLAGPYRGAPLSMVVISPAIVGPYDLGVIAVRTALRVDPVTAQGSAFSDPFPQIFQGIPVRIRDIRLNLDRPDFTLNPTSCARKEIEAHVTGTGGLVGSTADDTAADLRQPFQAADCASLGFRPRLSLRLRGGIHRGAHPKLSATVTYPKRGAYSNIAAASVALPHSEFLDQSHIGTVCTRVQFAADACPAAAVYGKAEAKTPLFDEPLKGPVYLRSSSHPLPDMVAVLRGPAAQPVEVDLSGRIDSVHGGIRNSFELVPDAPVESFVLSLRGGKRGLLVNSTDLCAETYRATARFTAHNGKRIVLHPALANGCKRKQAKKVGKHGKRRVRGR